VKLEAVINMHEPNSLFPSVVTPVSRNLNGFAVRNQDGINAKTIDFAAKHSAVIDIKKQQKIITLFTGGARWDQVENLVE
jgi:hypothetical protein